MFLFFIFSIFPVSVKAENWSSYSSKVAGEVFVCNLDNPSSVYRIDGVGVTAHFEDGSSYTVYTSQDSKGEGGKYFFPSRVQYFYFTYELPNGVPEVDDPYLCWFSWDYLSTVVFVDDKGFNKLSGVYVDEIREGYEIHPISNFYDVTKDTREFIFQELTPGQKYDLYYFAYRTVDIFTWVGKSGCNYRFCWESPHFERDDDYQFFPLGVTFTADELGEITVFSKNGRIALLDEEGNVFPVILKRDKYLYSLLSW